MFDDVVGCHCYATIGLLAGTRLDEELILTQPIFVIRFYTDNISLVLQCFLSFRCTEEMKSLLSLF